MEGGETKQNRARFFREKCQLISVEEMMKLENHCCIVPGVVTDSGEYDGWY